MNTMIQNMKTITQTALTTGRTCKLLSVLLFLLLQASAAFAGEWVDVTAAFVKNPSYAGNSYAYWEGTTPGGYNPKENAEFYQMNYSTYQVITGLTPGQYRVGVQAFYRIGNAANDYDLYNSGSTNDYQFARLYASSSDDYNSVQLPPISAAAVAQSYGGEPQTVGNGLYVPNNMVAAAAWFAAGCYSNSVTCYVGDDGQLTIGLEKLTTIYEDWTCFDNWTLEYYEEQSVTRISSLSFDKSAYTLAQGKTLELPLTILPANASNKILQWTSSDPSVATVSDAGVVTALKGGKVIISAATTDLSGITATCQLTVTNSLSTQRDWVNITDDYVINPRFDGNDVRTGWYGTQLSAANPKENAEHYNKSYDTYQVLSGLPAGKYRVSLNAFYRMGSSANDYDLYSSGDYADYQYAQLYAESSVSKDYAEPLKPASSGLSTTYYGGNVWQYYDNEEGTYYYMPNNMLAADAWFQAGYYQNSLECQVGSNGQLVIGIRKYNGHSEDWTCLDNWKLEYYGNVRLVTGVTLSQTSAQLVVNENLQLTASISPSTAIYRRLVWTSSDESVLSVDQNGYVTTHNSGHATVTVSSTDGSEKSATCDIYVLSPEVSSENIVINEIMVHNVDVYLDPSFNYGPWVELYNPTSITVSLGGLYVSDDPTNLRQHRLLDDYGILPAHGYALLNFDHHEVWTKASYRQIDGDLKSKGGTIIISDGQTIFAQQDYPEPISRTSYARTVDGTGDWAIAGNPTPSASNADGHFATQQLPAPVVDTPAQLFTSALTIRVEIPEGTTLRYTTDGTAPTLTNGSVSQTGVFNVSSTTCFRFRLFQDGKLPSTVVTRSYITDSGNEPFPIISIVTDSQNIYGSYGVFSTSENGRPGNGQASACNWNMDWDRPVNFEYINEKGECVVSQECDFATCGGWSRAFTPHAFKLKAKKTYDLLNTFDYQFFDDKPYLKHKTLQIRNGGNDTSNRIKDAALQGVVERSGIYVDYQSWKPVHVYINGSPYAVLNMREPNNKDFAYSNYGLDTDLIDQFEISPDSGYVQMRGTDESFLRWYDLSYNANDDDAYEEISRLVDLDNYINYMAIELYIGNWDWPQNNVKGFRSQQDGKFHFVLFDLDGALSTTSPISGFLGKQYYQFDRLYGYDYSQQKSIDSQRNNREIKFVTIFSNMLQNEDFRKRFIDAYCLVAGSVFTPDMVREVVNERANQLAQGNYVSPWSTANTLISSFSNRQGTLISHLQSMLGLSASDRFSATLSSNIDEGRLLLNGQPVPTGSFDGQLFLPVTLRAEAPAGYRFLGWGKQSATSSQTLFDMGSDWSYYDKGSFDGIQWYSTTYSVRPWDSGITPIGYDYNNQHPEIQTTTQGYQTTYYLRKNITIEQVATEGTYQLDWIADDGFVLYVNGTEAARYNMPDGTITFDTYATTYAHNNPDNGSLTIPASLLRKGINVIAVELHNNAANSTDIYWNAALRLISSKPSQQIVSTSQELTIDDAATTQLTALWEQLDDDQLLAAASTPVKINEVSAGNTIYINEYFKKNDWIELYNTTDQPIDIAGMYITDKLSKPQKYQIPEASSVVATYTTIIPARGYLVIWADQLLPDKEIHTGFKLGNEDNEVVMLTSADGTWADTLAYKIHTGEQTVGLYPDGGSQAYIMDSPTIGRSNLLTSYAQQFEQYRPEPVIPEPNAIQELSTQNAVSTSDEWFDLQGRRVPATNLRRGIYIRGGQKVIIR